jgi:hypothetical protein
MKLIFIMVSTVSAAFFVMMSTPFAIDIADRILSMAANALSLHEAPTLSVLSILAITGLYLYLALKQRRN